MAENQPGKFISLAPDLEPQKVEYGDRGHGREEKINQSTLLEEWTKNKELTKEKTFVLGSEVKNQEKVKIMTKYHLHVT